MTMSADERCRKLQEMKIDEGDMIIPEKINYNIIIRTRRHSRLKLTVKCFCGYFSRPVTI